MMTTSWNSTGPGTEQLVEQGTMMSEVEAFMASRVGELQEYGWSNEKIAEALGVGEEFVEEYSPGYNEY